MNSNSLPDLKYVGFEKEKLSLHLLLQIVGKIKLGLMPRKNHWWNITHYVNQQGFSTGPIPYNNGFSNFSIDFNFIKHQLEIATSEGGFELLKLKNGLSVSYFYNEIFKVLETLDIKVDIVDKPFDLGIQNKFSNLSEVHHYHKDYAEKLWKSLLWINGVFNEFSGRFYGKTCPVHLYWHSMDLAVTRFSGKKAPKMPDAARLSDRDAYSHECISFGFWPGDDTLKEPAFYSYTFPNPERLEKQTLQPKTAIWEMESGSPMALLTYANLRSEKNPRQALLNFMESAYLAGDGLSGWSIEALKVPKLTRL